MARGELLKKLFYSYAHGDGSGFYDVATEIIRDEESKNNRVLANALRRTLGDAKNPHFSGIAQQGDKALRKLNVVPFEREKHLPLVETITPERRPSDLILKRSNQHLLLSLVNEFRKQDTLGAHGLRPRSRLLFCGQRWLGKTGHRDRWRFWSYLA